MTTAITSRSRPAGRLLVLLVMAVLGGVLGMHALVPAGAPDAHTMVMAHPADGEHVSAGCSHTADGPDHLDHADGACAAAGIGSPYAPPALTAAAVDTSAVSVPAVGAHASAESGRAPPDLSELQLLRI
ncbi:DUF6153 family protein [Streptomyces sp. NPDC059866]|uniref:DUF6153 family protein n=1 Tax=Streptomyces sp. NPDC059866 TaxID=3346978 RepID=UPI0036591FDD